MHIRLATPADGPRLAEIYRPAVVSQSISFELEPPNGLEMGRRVAGIIARTPWLVVEADESVQGYAYAGPHRERAAYAWSVEVSAYIDAEAHRSGLGRALYASLLAVLRLQGFQSAYAGIALPNDASVRFHEAMGFVPVGTYHRVGYKHGKWRDVRWYEQALGAGNDEPVLPRPLAAILAEPGLAGAVRAGQDLLR